MAKKDHKPVVVTESKILCACGQLFIGNKGMTTGDTVDVVDLFAGHYQDNNN